VFSNVEIKNHNTIINNNKNSGFLNGILIFWEKKTAIKRRRNAIIKKKKLASFLNSPKKDNPSKELNGIKKTPKKKVKLLPFLM
jgi:hypothetical protein